MKNLRRLASLALVLALVGIAPATAASIRFPYSIGMMYVGESHTIVPTLSGLSASKLVWQSSRPGVVSVDGGTVTACAQGLALVRASSGGASALCGVVVLPEVLTLCAGETAQLPACRAMTYQVSDPNVAAASASGVVTALSVGRTTVTVGLGTARKRVTVQVTGAVSQSRAAQLDCAAEAEQIVLVEYRGNARADVSFHEKQNGVWTLLASTYAYVGANGLGKTKEGDKKTPSGTYNLTTPFGILADPGAQMPYTQVTQYHYWCGTSSSEYYNQLCDSRVNGRKAGSADEKLYRAKGYYNYAMFIDYNAAGEAGKGSCIFLHCIGGKDWTYGCIAIPEAYMRTCVCWAREGCKIVIQQG